MSNATDKKPLLPPDEKFWKKYSPHQEMPISWAGSFILHGIAIGVLVLSGVLLANYRQSEEFRPVNHDVVQMVGPGDGRDEGLGGGGDGKPVGPKEIVIQQPITRPEVPQVKLVPMPEAPKIEFSPMPMSDVPMDSDAFAELVKIQDDVQREIAKEMEKQLAKADASKPAIELPGMKKDVGKGGPIGPGPVGPGVGNNKGPGVGQGGIPGARPATKQEIFSGRWRFDMSGNAKEHAAKLDAVGVTLAIPDPLQTGFLFIRNLKQRPAQARKENFAQFKDAVKWYNTNPGSVQALARELQLPYVPKYVVLLLPKDREDKMAAEETRFAQANGRDPRTLRETWFDFRLQGGAYEPVGIKQE